MATMQQSPKFAQQRQPASTATVVDAPAHSLRERLLKRWTGKQLELLNEQRRAVASELRSIPDRMQKVTNQARLVLELADDFRSGRYRDISWLAMAVAAGCLVYAVSPTDVVPDIIPGLGAIDDMVVLTVAMRLLKKDLCAYIHFKGYSEQDYF